MLIHSIRRKFGKDVILNVRGAGWMAPKFMTGSLRRAALLWMTGLLTVVGLVTILVAYMLRPQRN